MYRTHSSLFPDASHLEIIPCVRVMSSMYHQPDTENGRSVPAPLVKLKASLSATLTQSPVPSKMAAFPRLPLVHVALPVSVPVFPFPEKSVAFVPVPSLKLQ